MAANTTLENAKKKKQDEFYTQLVDIEKELRHYQGHFRGKSVFCNCDDPYESDFFKYFAMNFKPLGLRKLTATCYKGSPMAWKQMLPFFEEKRRADADRRRPYKIEISEVYDANDDGAVNPMDKVEAVKWYRKAADHGDTLAKKNLVRLRKLSSV